jgi:hypothetical protein
MAPSSGAQVQKPPRRAACAAYRLFTCNVSLDERNMKNIIGYYFGVSFLNIDMYFFTRGFTHRNVKIYPLRQQIDIYFW